MAIIDGQEALKEARELVEVADRRPRGYLTVVLSILAAGFAFGWWKEREGRQADNKEFVRVIIQVSQDGLEAAKKGGAYADSAISLQEQLIKILTKK